MLRFGIQLLLACLTLAAAHAGSRSSADYSVNADANNSGGLRLTSTAYTVDASMNDIGGYASASNPTTFVKSGYAGQLYDLVNFSVTTTQTTVTPDSTIQLGVTNLLDDGSSLALTTATPSYQAVSGPIVSISPTGQIVFGTVSTPTNAVVLATYNGVSSQLTFSIVPLASSLAADTPTLPFLALLVLGGVLFLCARRQLLLQPARARR